MLPDKEHQQHHTNVQYFIFGKVGDVDKLAQEYFSNNIYCDGITDFEEMVAKRSYKAGYKDTSAKKYSEENVKNYLNFVEDNYHYHSDAWYNRDTDEHFTREQIFNIWKQSQSCK